MPIQHHHGADGQVCVAEHQACDTRDALPPDGMPGFGDPPIGTTGRDLPPHLLVETASLRPALGDPTSQRLARLLSLHPEIDRQYRDVDLRKIGAAKRRHLLEAISRRLNIPHPA